MRRRAHPYHFIHILTFANYYKYLFVSLSAVQWKSILPLGCLIRRPDLFQVGLPSAALTTIYHKSGTIVLSAFTIFYKTFHWSTQLQILLAREWCRIYRKKESNTFGSQVHNFKTLIIKSLTTVNYFFIKNKSNLKEWKCLFSPSDSRVIGIEDGFSWKTNYFSLRIFLKTVYASSGNVYASSLKFATF